MSCDDSGPFDPEEGFSVRSRSSVASSILNHVNNGVVGAGSIGIAVATGLGAAANGDSLPSDTGSPGPGSNVVSPIVTRSVKLEFGACALSTLAEF